MRDLQKVRKIYISGPMAGLPKLNQAEFAKAEERLIERGDIAVNPHRIGPIEHAGPCVRLYPEQDGEHNGGCYVRGDIAEMVTCDRVYVLKGARDSVGANIEIDLARALKIPLECEDPDDAPYWAGR